MGIWTESQLWKRARTWQRCETWVRSTCAEKFSKSCLQNFSLSNSLRDDKNDEIYYLSMFSIHHLVHDKFIISCLAHSSTKNLPENLPPPQQHHHILDFQLSLALSMILKQDISKWFPCLSIHEELVWDELGGDCMLVCECIIRIYSL